MLFSRRLSSSKYDSHSSKSEGKERSLLGDLFQDNEFTSMSNNLCCTCPCLRKNGARN